MKGLDQVKLHKSNKDPELYHYFNAKKEKLWMFRHKYYDVLGKRKEKKKSSFKTEKDALKALLEVKAATLRGESRQVEQDQLTVGQWLDIWYNAHKNDWKVTSRKQREMAIRLQMKPLLGHYKLQKLDRTTYKREFLNVLENKYKTSTVELLHTLFKVAINAAVEDELLTRNRFTKFTIGCEEENQEKPNNYFTPAELVTFLEAAQLNDNITNYSFFLTLAYTGLRRGEALGLQWKNVNFQKKTITVERTRDNDGIRTPKTKNSYRTILIDDLLVKQLKIYRVWCIEKMLSNGETLKGDTLVFISSQTGDPVAHTSVYYAMKRIIKTTDLPSNVTLHGLRHTHATILLNRGSNVKVIADRLGNSPQMIYDIYGHVLEELETETVNLFSDSLGAVGADFGAKS